ncbi:nuclear transport factor 2 family protein [Robertmurraya kyonggiensis]|uniref:Nuclear transport factor 2 family protein n=1 Tax=Robertmurraya kyonggiensis TaxID=1037680 RepID=A0A4U1DC56_9BACI|nr:nuclear transport factor 2 family protein [Robertmurraya kyonggiensis]TKC19217.1 nuclear transport factor 2 family protein [Robertmurraya kyonggiensis]
MKDIKDVLVDYMQAWNDGFVSKDGDMIREFMSKNFIGYWCHGNLNKPDEYDYHYDVNGVLQQYENAEKSFEPYSITERKNGEEYLILGREINRINGEPFPAQCMFIWRKEQENWKLLREYIELER